MSENNERDELDIQQTKELVEQDAELSRLRVLISTFIALSLFIVLHSVYSIYDQATDESIPLTICPREYNLDAPVILPSITETDKLYAQDRWVRGFVRRLILNSYPRTAEDAEKFFTFMRDHSDGPIRIKYQAFLNDMESIKSKINSGNYIRFYPTSSKDLKIRKESDGRWVAEINGFMTKNLSNLQERLTPTLRFVIEARKATRENPSGLVLVDAKTELIADYISGAVKVEKAEIKDDK